MVSQRAISTRRTGASVSYLEVGNNGALNDKSSDSSVRRTCHAAWHRWPRNHVEPIQVHLVRGEASCTHTRKLHGVNRRRRKRTSRMVGKHEAWPRVGKTTYDRRRRKSTQAMPFWRRRVNGEGGGWRNGKRKRLQIRNAVEEETRDRRYTRKERGEVRSRQRARDKRQD